MCESKKIEVPAGERQTHGNRPCLWEVNPELASQLVNPQDGWKLTAMSHKKVLWTCGKHEWDATVNSRSKGSGCPYCSGNKVTAETCLSTVNPELASQLVDQSLAAKLTAMSGKKVLWSCDCGYEWLARVADRSNGKGCPYCSGRMATAETCLAAVNPSLASELVNPSDGWKLTANSHKKVLWSCDCGYEWKSTVDHRSNGTGCPKCSSSKMNKWSAELCEELGLDFAAEAKFDDCKSERPLPFDLAIFDENKKVAILIECQGIQHYESVSHFGGDEKLAKQQKHDQIKRDWCKANGIKLIEIDYTFRDAGKDAFKDELKRRLGTT